MLGYIELELISKQAEAHRGEWRATHAAVLQALFAFRNSQTGRCFPSQESIAKACGISVRTIKRALHDLRAWGVIRAKQARRRETGNYASAQYDFPFTACVDRGPTVAHGGGPTMAHGGGPTVAHEAEALKRNLEAKGGSERKSPQPHHPRRDYKQTDFDERDWRKLNQELNRMREAVIGRRVEDPDAFFATACVRAGISAKRGRALWEQMSA